MNLADLLTASAYRYPQKVAVIDDHGKATYRELEQMACSVASKLHQHGVEKGDRIAVAMPARHEFVAVYIGILKLGAVVVPLSLMLRGRDLSGALHQCRARYFIAMSSAAYPDFADAVLEGLEGADIPPHCWLGGDLLAKRVTVAHEAIETLWKGECTDFPSLEGLTEEPAIIGFTSGTTGTPKGAIITHLHEYLNTLQLGENLGFSQVSKLLSPLSLAAGFGRMVGLGIPLAFGATVRYVDRFNPVQVWNCLEQEPVTEIVAVPAMYYALLESSGKVMSGQAGPPDCTEHLRVGIFGGAPMSQALRDRLKNGLGISLIQGYGTTENGCVATTPGAPSNPEPNNELMPLPGLVLRIVDEKDNDVAEGEVGEVITRGPTIMQGYENDPEATCAKIKSGWLRSGDLARYLGCGRFQLVDRKMATINRGGYKAYPAEIEAHLESHPEVHQAVVLGAPDERLGQEVIAYLILHPKSKAEEADLVAWGKDTLPAHAYPRRIRIVDGLPMMVTGKVDRKQLPPF